MSKRSYSQFEVGYQCAIDDVMRWGVQRIKAGDLSVGEVLGAMFHDLAQQRRLELEELRDFNRLSDSVDNVNGRTN